LPKVQPEFDVDERLFISQDDSQRRSEASWQSIGRGGTEALRQVRFRLTQPVRHIQLAIYRRCRRDMPLRLFARAGAP
jgi:hypothetical protein